MSRMCGLPLIDTAARPAAESGKRGRPPSGMSVRFALAAFSPWRYRDRASESPLGCGRM